MRSLWRCLFANDFDYKKEGEEETWPARLDRGWRTACIRRSVYPRSVRSLTTASMLPQRLPILGAAWRYWAW